MRKIGGVTYRIQRRKEMKERLEGQDWRGGGGGGGVLTTTARACRRLAQTVAGLRHFETDRAFLSLSLPLSLSLSFSLSHSLSLALFSTLRQSSCCLAVPSSSSRLKHTVSRRRERRRGLCICRRCLALRLARALQEGCVHTFYIYIETRACACARARVFFSFPILLREQWSA